jgi:hypothetical protein
LIISVKLILFLSSLNIISLHQEVRGIFVIKAAVEMQNNPVYLHEVVGVFQQILKAFLVLNIEKRSHPSTQTTTAAPKPSRVPLTLMLMVIY